ncbi:glycosyltransferase [uncultured Paraglaciecola sp.]|uniref:glycosyltransferase family 2 protein n=1 Tax=uncultured Paraglaciecola sp. TaxID=1765024 RepID=UPI002595B90E|nr:glycosyltransferase [uncultured Paraglaciecola sp.]
MAIKRYLMMGAKLGIGCFPKPVRNFVKKSPALTSLYSRSLQKSGLFYGFPSQRKLQALYVNIIKSQDVKITNIIRDSVIVNPKIDVVIFTTEKGRVESTLVSLSTQVDYINTVYIVNPEKHYIQSSDIACDFVVIDGISSIQRTENSVPLLLLNQGDVLHSQALAIITRQVLEGVLYTDSDEINDESERCNARMLPAWNPDYQLSAGYIETAIVILPKIMDMFCVSNHVSITAFVACLCDNKFDIAIKHLPLSLVSYSDSNKRKLKDLKALVGIIESIGASAKLDRNYLVNKVHWPINKNPLVSLIIPTKNSKNLVQNCIESILSKTSYTNYEILLIDNNSDEKESLEYFALLSSHPKVTVLKYPYPFNYSAINNFAVKHAQGSVVGLVNNDIEVISPDWLHFMVGHVLREDIGCVGAKLLYPDNRIQHAGVVMGYGGGAGHAHKYFPRYHPGYLNRLIASHNFSAVTAACLLVKKSDYLAVGGLNETDLTVAFNDVDFCLRVLESGRRNIYCAEAELYHHESISRGLDDTTQKRARFESELVYLQETWHAYIEHDPAYNPNLTLKRENFSIRE